MLSTHPTDDASQLLLQFAALLAFLSVCFCLPVFGIRIAGETACGRRMFAWSIEHLLIATTMLVVGLFAVLSWDANNDDRLLLLINASSEDRADFVGAKNCRWHDSDA